jgi:hypothetical protein
MVESVRYNRAGLLAILHYKKHRDGTNNSKIKGLGFVDKLYLLFVDDIGFSKFLAFLENHWWNVQRQVASLRGEFQAHIKGCRPIA